MNNPYFAEIGLDPGPSCLSVSRFTFSDLGKLGKALHCLQKAFGVLFDRDDKKHTVDVVSFYKGDADVVKSVLVDEAEALYVCQVSIDEFM